MNKMQIQKWVREQGYKRVEDITYAEYKEDVSLYIIPKNRKNIDSGQLMSTVFFD